MTSHFKHIKTRHGVTKPFEEMLRDGDSAGNLAGRQNPQLSLLEGGAPMAAHLESAKQQLATFAVVGLTERYRETLILCEALLGLSLGQPKYLNLGQPSGELWSTEMTEKIESLNRYDTELYRFAEQIFERRLQEMLADS